MRVCAGCANRNEATSYTDPENEAVIQSALARLVRGKTLLVIAHRLSTIADADQIIVVNQGKIVQQGTHDELVAIPGKYKEFIDIRKKAEGWNLAE